MTTDSITVYFHPFVSLPQIIPLFSYISRLTDQAQKVVHHWCSAAMVVMCLAVLLGFAEKGNAQEDKKNPIARIYNKLKVGNGRLLPLPLLEYSPETSFGFGITVQYIFRFKDDTLGKISMAGLPGLYTLRKQYIINPNWDFYIRKERFRLTGSFDYRKYPEFFYGIGNFTKSSSKETLTARYLLLEHRFMVRVRHRLYMGVQHRYEYAYDLQYKKNGIMDTANVPGNHGYTASGIGVTAIYDSRDKGLYPLTGAYVVFGNYFYFRQIGSSVRVMNFEVDARKYFNPGGMHVIAMQGLFKFNLGEPAYKMMAQLGGAETMRGYYLGRFRERHLLAGQVEYRFPIWWRFMGAAFFGIGEVAHELKDLTLKGIKYSYGAGIRLRLDKEERIHLRFDAGFGVEGAKGFYFQINEAF